MKYFYIFALFILSGSVAADFPFDSVYVMDDDIIAVEAEDCYAGSYWKFETQISGYTGSGYMRYDGPEALCAEGKTDEISPFDQGGAQRERSMNECQTDMEKRLRIPVRLPVRAQYQINARCFAYTFGVGPESHASGKDHTAWTMVEEMLPFTAAGSGHTEEGATNRWTWFAFGPGSNNYPPAQVGYGLDPGDYVFYLGGRHTNFRADRIHIYRKIGKDLYPALDTVATLAVTKKTARENTTVIGRREITRENVSKPDLFFTAGASAAMYTLQGRRIDGASTATGRMQSGACLVHDNGCRAGLILLK